MFHILKHLVIREEKSVDRKQYCTIGHCHFLRGTLIVLTDKLYEYCAEWEFGITFVIGEIRKQTLKKLEMCTSNLSSTSLNEAQRNFAYRNIGDERNEDSR